MAPDYKSWLEPQNVQPKISFGAREEMAQVFDTFEPLEDDPF